MKTKLLKSVFLIAALLLYAGSLSAQTNLLQGANMESETGWTQTLLNTEAGSEPAVTWNYTDDIPSAGSGGALHVTGTTTSGNSQYCIYQAVELSTDSVYKLDGAFNFIQVNNSWCEVFIGEEPIDGLDYRAEDGFDLQLLTGVGTWATPAKNNGTFAIDASPYNVFIPDTSGTYFFVLKTGSTSWDGSSQTFEIVLDELSLTAYREKPHTAFSSGNAVGFAPLTVDFTNETRFATTYAWDFGDGSTSTDENPTHTYNDAGTYTVTLTATNEIGDSVVTKTDFVKANEKPELPPGEMLYGGNMEDPNLWNVTNLSTDVDPPTATWNYTDASTAFGEGGALHITGEATNGTTHYCIWQPVTLHKDSVYHFDAAFRALSDLDHFWAEAFIGTVPPEDGSDYGDDTIKIAYFNTWESCTGNSVDGTFTNDGCEAIGPYQPEENGTYYFVLKTGVTDWEGNTYSFEILIDEITLQESTYTPAAIADFFSDVTEGDAPLTVYFTDLSENATAWDWNFGDGNSSTDQSPSHTYEDAGVYTVTLIASNEVGADTMTVEDLITVNPVGFAESPYGGKLHVYPNPSTGSVNVEIPENLKGEIVVTGILGNELMRKKLQSGQQVINLEIDKQGIYILMVNSQEKSYRGRIVIR